MNHTLVSPAELIDSLNWRYATKLFDTERPLEPELVSQIEEVLTLSASSGGLQPWKFVLVSDHETKQKLQAAAYGQVQVGTASHVVVFAARKHYTAKDVDEVIANIAETRNIPVESLEAFRGMLVGGIVEAMDEPTRQTWAAKQTYIALGNLLTSAAVLGIDASPMEGFSVPEFNEILGLDALDLTATVIAPIGYRSADDKYAAYAKARLPKEKLIIRV
ncbi:MAG: NAD(P)H-dependent oxidoreductase [Verrucomicrobiota bacterium JB022]|nr:NAD(P)H-dependent oxidoreductase [Verrucomicrobiota bacterium JB022]